MNKSLVIDFNMMKTGCGLRPRIGFNPNPTDGGAGLRGVSGRADELHTLDRSEIYLFAYNEARSVQI